MAPLILLIVLVAVATLAPFLGRDTSTGGHYEDYPDERGWWPAAPDAMPRPRY